MNLCKRFAQQEESKKRVSLSMAEVDSEYNILSKQQQEKLHQQKMQMRLNNEKYLRSHPELKALVSLFMRTLLEDKPEKPELFAAEFFTRPDIKEIVLKSVGMK